jgi:hypothetical protein
MDKKCTKCNITKPYCEFHRRGNGYKSVCKVCRLSEHEVNRVRAARYYRSHQQKCIETNHNWKIKNKYKMMKYKNNWRFRHKDKALAHWAVSNALRNGHLIRECCEVCGDINTHAHHDDYNKRLDVVWLCDHHHKERHGVLINA